MSSSCRRRGAPGRLRTVNRSRCPKDVKAARGGCRALPSACSPHRAGSDIVRAAVKRAIFHRRRWGWLVLLTCATLGSGPVKAEGSPLRRIVSNIDAFTSDGTRYVAWEVPGQKPIFVLDTRTGRRQAIDSPCRLEDKAAAAAGRFLLQC